MFNDISTLKGKLEDDYHRNVILNYCFKGLSIILGLISTRLILGYLGITLYGLWLTISSVISWMSSGDLGIGNGLRNELAKAFGEGDKEKEVKLIVSAFNSMLKVSGTLFAIIVVLSEIFFYIGILPPAVRIAMHTTSIFFCINLLLGVSQSVALGYQKSWLTSLTASEIQICLILSVIFMKAVGIEANLNFYAVVNGLCTTIPNIILIYILNSKGIKVINSNKSKIDRAISKSIMNTGIQFFGIQICAVILYSTDNLIINKIISSDMVTKYEVISKIYNTGNGLFSILLIALWSAVTYQLAQKNIKWVKDKIKQLLVFWFVYSGGVIIISLCFNFIVKIWLGTDAINYEWTIITLFGVYSSMTAFSAIFVNVLNGMGKIRLQFALAVVSALINIPLSIVFANDFGMGIFGIKFATFLSAAITAIIMPIQVVGELRKMERRAK